MRGGSLGRAPPRALPPGPQRPQSRPPFDCALYRISDEPPRNLLLHSLLVARFRPKGYIKNAREGRPSTGGNRPVPSPALPVLSSSLVRTHRRKPNARSQATLFDRMPDTARCNCDCHAGVSGGRGAGPRGDLSLELQCLFHFVVVFNVDVGVPALFTERDFLLRSECPWVRVTSDRVGERRSGRRLVC